MVLKNRLRAYRAELGLNQQEFGNRGCRVNEK